MGFDAVPRAGRGVLIMSSQAKITALYHAANAGNPAAQKAVGAIVVGARSGNLEAKGLKRMLDQAHAQANPGIFAQGAGAPAFGARGLPTMHRVGLSFGASGPTLTPDQKTQLLGLMNAAIASGQMKTTLAHPSVFAVSNVRATRPVTATSIAQAAAAQARAQAAVAKTVQQPRIQSTSLASLLR